MWPRSLGWIPDNIATLDSDAPETKRWKNVLEGTYLGLATDLLTGFSRLSAQVDGDPGYWSFEGPGNAVFTNPMALNTSVNTDTYGTYFFTYNGCGTSSDAVIINMNNTQPIITGPDTTICLQEFELSAEIDGDPGYWSFEGPGNAVFNNPNELITLVSIDTYGIYNFTYNGCGTISQELSVNSISEPPLITVPTEDLIIYCELSTNLNVNVISDI